MLPARRLSLAVFVCGVAHGALTVAGSASSATIQSDRVFHREARFDVAAIFDRARNRVVAFGGFAGTTPTFDLQVLDLAVDRGWRPAQATGTGPPDDSSVQGVYDPVHDRMLVLSGGPAGNRVFALDLASFEWQELHPAGTAPPLAFTGAAYDSRRGRVVGFGGFAADSAVTNTWALALEPSPAWVDLGHAPATARSQHVAAYDSTGDRLLVVDGLYEDPDTSFRLDDVWQLDLAGAPAWSQVQAVGSPPAPFNAACGIFDEANHRLVVFGGLRDGGNSNVTHTLSFPGGNATWTLLSDSLIALRRSNAIGLYDPLAGRLLVTGGVNALNTMKDDRVWARTLDASPGPWETMAVAGIVPFTEPSLPTTIVGPSAYEAPRGAFRVLMCQGTLAGFELSDESGITRWRRRAQAGPPPPRPGSVLLSAVPGPVDPVAGLSYAFTADTLYVLHDGDPDSWTRTPIVPARTGPFHGGMVWLDAPRNRLLCFGPQDGLWILSLGAAPAWTLAPDPCPVCDRTLLPMARDSARDRLLFTGGRMNVENVIDVYSLDLPTLGWSRLLPSGLVPQDRSGHTETYDSVNDRLVMAGGTGVFGMKYDNQVWAIQFGKEDPVGRWDRFDLGAQHLAAAVAPPTVDVPGKDAFLRALPGQRDLVQLGPVASVLDIEVGSPQGWIHDSTSTSIEFYVHNHATYVSPRDVTWRIDSGRAWPGYPMTGQVHVETLALVRAIVPVPDTAAFGGNPMQIVAWETGAPPESGDSIEILLVDRDVVFGPLVTGPGDWIWKPGMKDSLPAHLVNRDSSPRRIVVSWTVDRDWPGFAGSDTLDLLQLEAVDLAIPLAVPDTAADGTATMILEARRLERPEVASFASIHLHDITTPTRIALVDSRLSAQSGVELTWWTPLGAGADATIERRVEGGERETRGHVIADGSGRILFRDRDVARGQRFGYRAGVSSDEGMEWSEETWISVPGGRLAFVGSTGVVLRGVLRADVRLGDGGPARLDAFDVRGRRVAFHAFEQPAAGVQRVEFAGLAPGIYFLTLTGEGERVRRRAVVL